MAAGDRVAAALMDAYPQMRVDVGAVDHNIATMAAWCADRGVRLAPHVKTTMSEPIVARQAAAGVDRLTVATVGQAATVLSWGHRRVLIANEVVDEAGLGLLRTLIAGNPAASIACLVDSVAGVLRAAAAFAGSSLPLLVDVGTPGGRTGVRTVSAAVEVAAAVARESALRLVGVSGYEGVVGNARDDTTVAAVDAHCSRVSSAFQAMTGLFETDRPLLTMGGSVYPDRVVANVDGPLVLWSGCYVTHDHGVYARVGPPLGLRAAVTIRAVVLSRPEKDLAVVGAGRRELPYDAGLPVLLDGSGTVSALYDHHTVLHGAAELAVGDVVEFGISHPCSAFDRWPTYLAVRTGAEPEPWTTEF